jgi:hypothetical protein
MLAEWTRDPNVGSLFKPYQSDTFVREMLSFSLEDKTWATLTAAEKAEFTHKVTDAKYQNAINMLTCCIMHRWSLTTCFMTSQSPCRIWVKNVS